MRLKKELKRVEKTGRKVLKNPCYTSLEYLGEFNMNSHECVLFPDNRREYYGVLPQTFFSLASGCDYYHAKGIFVTTSRQETGPYFLLSSAKCLARGVPRYYEVGCKVLPITRTVGIDNLFFQHDEWAKFMSKNFVDRRAKHKGFQKQAKVRRSTFMSIYG